METASERGQRFGPAGLTDRSDRSWHCSPQAAERLETSVCETSRSNASPRDPQPDQADDRWGFLLARLL